MPVSVNKKKKSAVLTCEKCGVQLTVKLARITAAPHLDACEQAHEKHGWGYTLGFFAMFSGHEVYCPACARPKEKKCEHEPERPDTMQTVCTKCGEEIEPSDRGSSDEWKVIEEEETCPDCGGSGEPNDRSIEYVCRVCNGTGGVPCKPSSEGAPPYDAATATGMYDHD